MSCHDIGRGMASVANVVIGLYEGRQIGKDAAMRLVRAHLGVRQCALKGASHSGQETSTR